MTRDEVHTVLSRNPFEPLRLHLANGKHFDIPFREVAHVVRGGVLVLIGLKRGTHQAKSYDVFAFELIDRIEPLPAGPRRRRAS